MSELDRADRPSGWPVVILCGGKGTRLQEETSVIPKPMVTIGGYPILWHIMRYFSTFGSRRFFLCLGYKSEMVKRFVLDYRFVASSFAVQTATGAARSLGNPHGDLDWEIHCIDTGEQAMTGARISRVQPYLEEESFWLTYGDGLADIDLAGLQAFHEQHGRAVTVTAVHPPSRFGLLELDGSSVQRFSEKGRAPHDYINGGFFLCDRRVFSYVTDDDECIFEREPLERLAKDSQLMAYRHEGYWQCMDTMRDREVLEEAWSEGAPWKTW